MKITEENPTNTGRFGPSSSRNRVAMSVTYLCGSLPPATEQRRKVLRHMRQILTEES